MVWRIVRFTGLTLLFGFGKSCRLLRRLYLISLCLVGLTFLSMMLENSGVMKAGPAQKQWEPATGKTVKFSDVHGVDEAKEVGVL
jgi:ATP-dependent metalloprotease